MKKYLLPSGVRFYKANLHTHTTVSDGKRTPEEIKELYKSHGYSVVAYTDHDVMVPHNELSDADFLALVGVEFQINEFNSYPGRPGARTCHICFIAPTEDALQPLYNPKYIYVKNTSEYAHLVPHDEGAPLYERDYSVEGISDIVRIMREAGFFVTYNHPAWSLEGYPQYTGYRGFSAMEIYNHGAAVLGYESYAATVYDEMLRTGERLFTVAADDCHVKALPGEPGCDCFGGFVMIGAEELSYKAITEALHRGDFYASRGPIIEELYVEDGEVHIKTSDAASISYSTDTRVAKFASAGDGKLINEASFKIGDREKYFRLTVTDEYGKTAHTNAYFKEGL